MGATVNIYSVTLRQPDGTLTSRTLMSEAENPDVVREQIAAKLKHAGEDDWSIVAVDAIR